MLCCSSQIQPLWWIRSTKALPVFVANRVTKILDGSDVTQWRHVRTHENPADLPTRGLTPEELSKEDVWWHGPSFLLVPEQEWPPQPEVVETDASRSEVRKLQSHLERLHVHQGVVPVLAPFQQALLHRMGRFSSLRRGIRAMANLHCLMRRRKGLSRIHSFDTRGRVVGTDCAVGSVALFHLCDTCY